MSMSMVSSGIVGWSNSTHQPLLTFNPQIMVAWTEHHKLEFGQEQLQRRG
jgi:hypothetical protein